MGGLSTQAEIQPRFPFLTTAHMHMSIYLHSKPSHKFDHAIIGIKVQYPKAAKAHQAHPQKPRGKVNNPRNLSPNLIPSSNPHLQPRFGNQVPHLPSPSANPISQSESLEIVEATDQIPRKISKAAPRPPSPRPITDPSNSLLNLADTGFRYAATVSTF